MSADRWFAGIALGCVAAVSVALVSQHRFDMQPCPWCVLQRFISIVVGMLALLGEIFGDAGKHARSAFGVAQIPMGACVEIELIAELAA